MTAGSGIVVDDIGVIVVDDIVVIVEGGSVDVVDTVVVVDELSLDKSGNMTPLWRDNPISQVNWKRRMISNVKHKLINNFFLDDPEIFAIEKNLNLRAGNVET